MPITESKIKSGSLILGAGETESAVFNTQATNVSLSPKSKDAGEPVEVLDGSQLASDATTEWSLKAKAIQDFTDPAGLQSYSWDHDGETVPYIWKPAGNAGPSFAGNVRVGALEVGGDVAKRLDVDVEWQLTGKPAKTFPQAP